MVGIKSTFAALIGLMSVANAVPAFGNVGHAPAHAASAALAAEPAQDSPTWEPPKGKGADFDPRFQGAIGHPNAEVTVHHPNSTHISARDVAGVYECSKKSMRPLSSVITRPVY